MLNLHVERVLGPAGVFHCLRRSPCNYYYVIRRAVLPESNTVTGLIGRVRCKNRFYIFGGFNLEFLEIGEFVWSSRIFSIVSYMWLSIGGVISPNKCVTPELC